MVYLFNPIKGVKHTEISVVTRGNFLLKISMLCRSCGGLLLILYRESTVKWIINNILAKNRHGHCELTVTLLRIDINLATN